MNENYVFANNAQEMLEEFQMGETHVWVETETRNHVIRNNIQCKLDGIPKPIVFKNQGGGLWTATIQSPQLLNG